MSLITRMAAIAAMLALASCGGGSTSDPATPAPPPPPPVQKQAPVAAFDVSPASPVAGQQAAFTDRSTQAPASWSWNFGDGTTSTERNPAHVYAAPGHYAVVLSVSNEGGASQSTQQVTVAAAPASGIIQVSPSPAVNLATLSFATTLAQRPDSWSWNFGDGSTSTDASPTHSYKSAGTYAVTLAYAGAATGSGTLSYSLVVGHIGLAADSETAKAFIDSHNLARAGKMDGVVLKPAPTIPIPPLDWSQSAADVAQSYANQCIWGHNGARSADGTARGENLWASTGTATAATVPKSVVSAWGSESSSYVYSSNYQSSAGHFTQLVWSRTTKVGCSRPTVCAPGPYSPWPTRTDSWTIVVCDYEPPGNYQGQYAWYCDAANKVPCTP